MKAPKVCDPCLLHASLPHLVVSLLSLLNAVVFQEDNAGPHIEGSYRVWMEEAFKERGWKIELQAPQGSSLSLIEKPSDGH